MCAASPANAIIAREMLRRLVELSFPPDAVNTPGIAHVTADRLSRIHAPDGEKYQEFSPAIWKAKKTTVPEHNATWYRALWREPIEADGTIGGFGNSLQLVGIALSDLPASSDPVSLRVSDGGNPCSQTAAR